MSGLRYVGPGCVLGVPARDLDEAEVAQYGGRAFILTLMSPNTGRAIYVDDGAGPSQGVARTTDKMVEQDEED